MRTALMIIGFGLLGGSLTPRAEALPGLTPAEIAAGKLALFDGETTFGWRTAGKVTVDQGVLVLDAREQEASITSTTTFSAYQLRIESAPNSTAKLLRFSAGTLATPRLLQVSQSPTVWQIDSQDWQHQPGPIQLRVPPGEVARLQAITLTPMALRPLFNGRNLDGWKEFPGRKSKFTVTPEGWLQVQDGPGDLATLEQFDNFLFQVQCISHGKHLNSGIFFRCLPNEYQQGYEAQIRNEWQGDDRSKPVDFGTGAIYRRQPARKVVSTDREWFTLTIVAFGNHLATWVNGYQVTDFTDDRPAADNARKGAKTSAGTISIQGHDPTTHLSFRRLQIQPYPKTTPPASPNHERPH